MFTDILATAFAMLFALMMYKLMVSFVKKTHLSLENEINSFAGKLAKYEFTLFALRSGIEDRQINISKYTPFQRGTEIASAERAIEKMLANPPIQPIRGLKNHIFQTLYDALI
jgi:hypothetical protein